MANIQFYLIFLIIFNIYHLSNSQYTGLPKDKQSLSAALKQKIELICQYTGSDGNGEFTVWYKDSEILDKNLADRYEIITTQNETKLIITFNETDEKVGRWMVATGKSAWAYPSECQFGRISLNASPQKIVTDKAAESEQEGELIVRRIVKERVKFDCVIEPKLNPSNKLQKRLWEYSADNVTYGPLPAGVRRLTRTRIVIEKLNKTHQGYYRCSLNNQSIIALLRVKDPYAALWPFLGIVSTVLVLIVIILLFEKRQKDAKKKAAAQADDANNPLVTSSKKVIDDDVKKQTVNA